MKSFHTKLAALSAYQTPDLFRNWCTQLSPLFEQVLKHSPDRRVRLFSKAQTILLCIAMSLFRSLGIGAVASQLRLGARAKMKHALASSSLSKARERLGIEPVWTLFCALSENLWVRENSHIPAWRGLRELAFDGTSLCLQDEACLRKFFGEHVGPTGTRSSFPMMRLLVLMELGTHLLCGAVLGHYQVGELSLATQLLCRIPARSLTLMDRGFVSVAFLYQIRQLGCHRHWLVRIKKNTKYVVKKVLSSRTDYLVHVPISAEARKKDPALPSFLIARVMILRRKGKAPITLMTSLIDHEKYPGQDLGGRYVRRWEVEIGYRELKTTLLENSLTLRSKTPDGVVQECWGMLIAYQLLRVEMHRAAKKNGVDALRVSFISTLNYVRHCWLYYAWGDGQFVPQLFYRAWTTLRGFLLPERRTHRHYERMVRKKISPFKHNRKYSPTPKPPKLSAQQRKRLFSQASAP